MTTGSEPAKLLVVDDHADTRRLMTCVLRAGGYAVSTAGDYDEALRLARESRFDLVITDVWLPDRDGCELLAEVGAMYPVRAIVLSGLDAADYRGRCDRAGVRFMQKPVDVPKLLAATADELAAAASRAAGQSSSSSSALLPLTSSGPAMRPLRPRSSV